MNWESTISVEGVRYSVPHQLVDARVWARFHGDELIVTAVGEDGPVEVARHDRSAPGHPSIKTEHYPPREDKEADRTPRATTGEEAAFLALGPGAASWLIEAAAAGARRLKPKMAEAVALAKLHSVAEVDRALGAAAIAGRFAENDLISILSYQAGLESIEPSRPPNNTVSSRALPPGPASAPPATRTSTDGHPDPHHLRRPRRSAGRGHRADQAAQTPASAAGVERPDPHRQGPTLGPGRGREGPAGRGGRRTRCREPSNPPQAGRVPRGQDVRRLGRDQVVHIPPGPGLAEDAGVGRTPGEPLHLRPERHGKVALHGGAGADGGRSRPDRRLVHHRRPRGARPPSSRRRLPGQGDDAADPHRPDHRGRHRAPARFAGRCRGLLPLGGCRLRTAGAGRVEQPSPVRLRRDHAEDPGHRYRRPPPSPRSRRGHAG